MVTDQERIEAGLIGLKRALSVLDLHLDDRACQIIVKSVLGMAAPSGSPDQREPADVAWRHVL